MYGGYGYGYGFGRGRGRGGPKWATPTEAPPQLEPVPHPRPTAIRVAIPTADDRGLEAIVFQTFARAPYITIVDVENGRAIFSRSIKNTFAGYGGGVGRMLASYLASIGVRIVIAPHIGPNAAMILQQMGIAIYTVYPGIRVIDALRQLRLVY